MPSESFGTFEAQVDGPIPLEHLVHELRLQEPNRGKTGAKGAFDDKGMGCGSLWQLHAQVLPGPSWKCGSATPREFNTARPLLESRATCSSRFGPKVGKVNDSEERDVYPGKWDAFLKRLFLHDRGYVSVPYGKKGLKATCKRRPQVWTQTKGMFAG